MRFDEVDAQTFEAARKAALQQVRERAPLTHADVIEGWREDRVTGLRRNVVTGAWDDTCFVNVAPKRPA